MFLPCRRQLSIEAVCEIHHGVHLVQDPQPNETSSCGIVDGACEAAKLDYMVLELRKLPLLASHVDEEAIRSECIALRDRVEGKEKANGADIVANAKRLGQQAEEEDKQANRWAKICPRRCTKEYRDKDLY